MKIIKNLAVLSFLILGITTNALALSCEEKFEICDSLQPEPGVCEDAFYACQQEFTVTPIDWKEYLKDVDWNEVLPKYDGPLFKEFCPPGYSAPFRVYPVIEPLVQDDPSGSKRRIWCYVELPF